MAFEDLDRNKIEDEEVEQTAPAEESGNRAFFIAAGIIGAIALLALLCIAGYALFIVPNQLNRSQQKATLDAQNTAVAKAITMTSAALAAPTFTPVPTRTQVVVQNTATPTRTQVVVQASTRTPTSTSEAGAVDPRTATIAALQTRIAQTTQTVVPTSTALPTTGFADEVGMPTMMGAAMLLVVVIVLARRLRSI